MNNKNFLVLIWIGIALICCFSVGSCVAQYEECELKGGVLIRGVVGLECVKGIR